MNFSFAGDHNLRKYCIEKYGSIENLKYKAKNGEIIPQADLEVAYSEGLGDELPRDTDKAIGWLSTAVEKGCETPYILGKLGELLYRKGTLPHQRKAYEMYLRAANLGCTSSQLNLAEMYRCGVEGVVNEDLNEAFKWYKKAADEEPSPVGSDLGVYGGTMKKLENSIGGPKRKALIALYMNYRKGDCPEGQPQPTKAVYYLTRAAELGETKAQLELGQIFLTGRCGPQENKQDIVRARRWLGKAAASGDVRAKQLLQECEQTGVSQGDASLSEKDVEQAFDIQFEKLSQKYEANRHPFLISQPVIFSEEMLSEFDWSPTARIYLKAFKLVKEGFEILHNSNFTDERGIALIARGYLTENSILQAFPQRYFLRPKIFNLCEQCLQKNHCFFEGLLLSYALHDFERNISVESSKVDEKKVMCLKNLIHLIQETEPDSISEDPFEFENYSSWLYVLYEHLGAIYTVEGLNEKAAESFENSLKCCPSYFVSKRALGYSLLQLYCSRLNCEQANFSQDGPTPLPKKQTAKDREMPKYASAKDRAISKYATWTKEQLAETCKQVLKEYLKEAPSCSKIYPNACYYLAYLALNENNMKDFKEYYELGQDAEEKRLPFLDPINLPIKDSISPFYRLLSSSPEPVKCGNRACIKDVKESDLKFCGRCRNRKYCSKECQRADWKNHKAFCSASKRRKADGGT